VRSSTSSVRGGTFDAYLWRFVGGRPIVNAWTALAKVPAETEESRALSRDLQKRGFRFVGPTICYAFMQTTGLVNDHTVDCFRWRALGGGRKRSRQTPGQKTVQA
jgi:DNA-3-methyladenine glycosylase I